MTDVILAVSGLAIAFFLGVASYAIWDNRSGQEWWAQLAHSVYRFIDQRRGEWPGRRQRDRP